MRIAFYAPLKPPNHPVPCGNRQMARLLIAALEMAGHHVEVASTLRAYRGRFDEAEVGALRSAAEDETARLLTHWPAAARPDVWLSYHPYYKSPDLIGPCVAAALGIPYVTAEASYAPRRDQEPWRVLQESVVDAVRRAAVNFCLTPADREGLARIADPATLVDLPVFIDTTRASAAGEVLERGAPRSRRKARSGTEGWRPEPPPRPSPTRGEGDEGQSSRIGTAPFFTSPLVGESLPRTRSGVGAERRVGVWGTEAWSGSPPTLVTVAMMRSSKLPSYRMLAEALARLMTESWRLVVIGDGPEHEAVRAAFALIPEDRVHWAGEQRPKQVMSYLKGADLYVWPGYGDAFGLAYLEAQSAGLPVVAQAIRSIPASVRDGDTGVLVPEGDVEGFADAIRRLLRDPLLRERMGRAAREFVHGERTVAHAAAILDAGLRRARDGALVRTP